ncbi:ABC transporter substrate-binding protein [Nocardioides sp. YIM 152315]|uniref:ABC transporter substrate-binding protein n=1 Tax=Nocardioides sp. YIM 152315 TaxID=3031760 RepID=UPI0023DA1ADB|nr:ABC transporter substrate-binding protein [Nocardioides sp. YIM 152315]MDF1604662.1 ABC transporter substrate-binding protein [Nocardioides sp. YIM 152315]
MKRTAIALVVSCLVLLGACGGTSDGGDNGDGGSADVDTSRVLRYVTSGGVISFDPHKTVSSSDFILLNYVYDRLVHTNTEGEPVPGLAESWEYSDDLTQLTLHLRTGLTFGDGTAFDADAVKANLERATEPDSIAAAQLATISGVEVVDDETVRIDMSQPGAEMLLTLSDLAGMMVNPSAFATQDKAAGLATQPDGIGRFTLGEVQPGSSYQFVAVDDYWDPDALPVAGIDVSVITDPQTALNTLSSGQSDCALVSPGMIDPAGQIPDAEVKSRSVLTQTILFFNQGKGALADPLVRQAINHAIDRDAVLQAAQEGHGEASEGLFPADFFVPNDETAHLLSYDPDKAEELLAEANADDVSFTALTLTIPQFVTTAEVVKDQLAKVGITMEIKALPPADLSMTFLKGEGDAVITGWTGRPDPSMLFTSYFAADAVQNVSHVSPDGFEQALAAANAIDDRAERGTALDAVQATVLEAGAVAPLTFNEVGTVCTSEVVGYEPPVIGISEFRGVGLVG